MAKLIALYKRPQDAAAFNAHYFDKHVPLAKKIPGLTRYDVSQGPVGVPGGRGDYHLVAILEFESMAAIEKGLNSPEGAATADDLANFAQAGVELLVFDTRPV